MKTVITFGTFDYFHPGHEFYLSQAAKLGDRLIVVIARDVNVYKIKNKFARQSELVRKQTVNNFLREANIVGRAVLGSKSNFYIALQKYRPAVIALGYDQSADLPALRTKMQDWSLISQVRRLESHHPEKYKSSFCL